MRMNVRRTIVAAVFFFVASAAEAAEPPMARSVSFFVSARNTVRNLSEGDLRRILNFGHTVGHAIEKLYSLSHGQAVAIGMVVACKISERITGLSREVTDNLTELLRRYHLPFFIFKNYPWF